MQIEEINNEQWVALFAPDGSFQAGTLTPDFATCLGQINLMHLNKMGQSYNRLSIKGFKILPVRLTMIQDGTAEDAFQRGKQKHS